MFLEYAFSFHFSYSLIVNFFINGILSLQNSLPPPISSTLPPPPPPPPPETLPSSPSQFAQ
jgi:hypothetical protein